MSKKSKASKKNEDVYLVVADETEGFQLALRYVSRLAKERNAHLAILYVMNKQDFQPWAGVARHLKGEQRHDTERLLARAAQVAQDITGKVPGIYIEEGGRFEKVLDVINNDPHIKKLVLGAEAHSHNPGPLVSYFTGKGLPHLRVPLTIIPGNVTPEIVDRME